MVLGLRNRLALFLVATLVIVQGLTMVTLYAVARGSLIDAGKQQLAQSARAFSHHMDTLSAHMAQDIKVMSLDYTVRQAVGRGDMRTALTTLRDFGQRVDASRVMLLHLDGTIAADTSDRHTAASGTPRVFPLPGLIERAKVSGLASGTAIMDGTPYRLVVTPVLLPDPIAWICVMVAIDDPFAEELRALSPLRKGVALLGMTAPNTGWSVIASAGDAMEPLYGVAPPGAPRSTAPMLMNKPLGRYLVLTLPLETEAGSPPMMAVLQYPLDEALEPYHQVMVYIGALMVVALIVGLIGMVLISRGVTRPLQALAQVAKNIARGTYTRPPPIGGDDEIAQLSSALDSMVTAIEEREDRIRHQARHDPVTGLPNRVSLEEELGPLLGGDGRDGALVVVGVDRLAEITNTLGHEVADCVIAEVGFRLCRMLPTARIHAGADGSRALVCRLSDHSFALLLPGVGERAVKGLALEILDYFDPPYSDQTLTVDLAVHVGIALYPRHGADPGTLLRRADVALYTARRRDPHIHIYDADQDPHRADRLSLMSDMRDAIDHDQMAMAFQPKLDLLRREVVATEALVRWTHPRRGFVPPDSFIPLAEETGAIRHLTRWAIDHALHQISDWRAAGADITVAVNLSVRDLADPGLPDWIEQRVSAHGVTVDALTLEVTESAIMADPASAMALLRRLAARGLELSIDDFGVGQSSFSYLRRLPAREIKIDKSFITALPQTPADQAIVRSIIEVGHNLGCRVTAEGVEDQSTLDILTEMGCDLAQGYFIARPLMPDAFADFMVNGAFPVAGRSTQAQAIGG